MTFENDLKTPYMVIQSTLSYENTLSARETGCLREKSTWKAEK